MCLNDTLMMKQIISDPFCMHLKLTEMLALLF